MSNIDTPTHVLTTGDVARLLGVAPRTAAKVMDRGELESWRLPGGKDRRTSRAMFVEFAAKHGIPLDEIEVDRMAMVDGLGMPKPRAIRSGRWPATQHAHLANHPYCEACGCKVRKLLNVHHIKPFHRFPELELEWTNLITLCESPSHSCHLIFGHLLNWSSWNVDVVHDAKSFRLKLANRPGTPPPTMPPATSSTPPVAAHAALDSNETRRAA